MFKKLLIFAVGTFAVSKALKKEKNKPYWYYFSVEQSTGKIHITKGKSHDYQNKFFYNLDKDSTTFYSIELDSEYGTFARLVLAEAHTEKNYECFTAIACVIRNRLKSSFWNYKNYFDVVFAPGQFAGVNLSIFKNTASEIKKEPEYMKSFIKTISAVLTALYLDSHYAGDAEGFNLSETSCPFDKRYYNCEKINLHCDCKTQFWKAIPK